MPTKKFPNLSLDDGAPLRTPEDVRNLFLQSNCSISAWARTTGFTYYSVIAVASGRQAAKSGKSRKIAELLGMARPSTQPVEPDFNFELQPAEGEPLRSPEEVRMIFLEKNITIGSWAAFHAFSPQLVRRVLKGESRGLRGESKTISIRLGIRREDLSNKPLNLVPELSAPLRTPDEIRHLLSQNCQSISGWAHATGFSRALTSQVLRGYCVGFRGQSRDIAIALGLLRATP